MSKIPEVVRGHAAYADGMKTNNTHDIDSTRRQTVTGLLALPLAAANAKAATIEVAVGAPGSDDELLKVREGVWRDWFGGNRAALMAILPSEFVGIGAGEGPFRSRTETIADAEGFVAAGNRLTALTFTDNRIQNFGDIRVIFCGFSFTTANTTGQARTTTGRATEIFRHSGGTWLHPGWHLDSGR
ncbi:MAG: nuclear transport factor 2 family protein [Vicinamibacteria bacterium]